MASLAPALEERRTPSMDNVSRLDADTAWAAFMRRDRAWDGRDIVLPDDPSAVLRAS